jgi:hypothetical protein
MWGRRAGLEGEDRLPVLSLRQDLESESFTTEDTESTEKEVKRRQRR